MKGYVLACFNSNPKKIAADRWHLRYCMLTRGKLLCFTSTDCDELKAELHLSSCDVTVEKVKHEEGSRPYPDETYRYVLCISTFGSTSGAVCSLATATESNRREWIDAANDAAHCGQATTPTVKTSQRVEATDARDENDSGDKSLLTTDIPTTMSASSPSQRDIGEEITRVNDES